MGAVLIFFPDQYLRYFNLAFLDLLHDGLCLLMERLSAAFTSVLIETTRMSFSSEPFDFVKAPSIRFGDCPRYPSL